MAEMNMTKAKETYNLLCKMLDNRNFHYEKIEDDLAIKSVFKGDDLPIEVVVRVNPKYQIVSLLSWMPFKVDESKRIDLSLATSVVNYGLADGSFDFNLEDGTILFRLTSSYRESTLSEELFEYMLMISASTIDDYNDKFFMISKGVLSVQQFIQEENAD